MCLRSSLESFSQASSYSLSIVVRYVGTCGGCGFLVQNKAMIPVVWHRVPELITVSILKHFGLYTSLSLYQMIRFMYFGVNLLCYDWH